MSLYRDVEMSIRFVITTGCIPLHAWCLFLISFSIKLNLYTLHHDSEIIEFDLSLVTLMIRMFLYF